MANQPAPPPPPGSMTRTVPARVVLAHLLPGPVQPVLGPLPDREPSLLRCGGLDEHVLVEVLGRPVPADVLGNPAARARALRARLPVGAVVAGYPALWVHTGGRPPGGLELLRNVEPGAVVTLGGVGCLRLERVVVDLARTAPPGLAVEAVLRARRAGLTRRELEPALLARRGGGMRGLRRARRLIDDLYAPAFQAPT
ncbi:hypothetical protein SAMN05216355_10633 [Actinomyces ruminicola]|uniref:Transcriptional regulator, AbiEi antitoxin, Type IV TA system n=1 Tax=Actinomyces ruminicola TaxID=332524 RepID=A0A1H0C7R9_9ACTO|nr:hypothetical protein [Actinomyces ruminicola]SDN53907.1 hypothetical protein SAMN05216355_10633 [Actinomyces ruminicola]